MHSRGVGVTLVHARARTATLMARTVTLILPCPAEIMARLDGSEPSRWQHYKPPDPFADGAPTDRDPRKVSLWAKGLVTLEVG